MSETHEKQRLLEYILNILRAAAKFKIAVEVEEDAVQSGLKDEDIKLLRTLKKDEVIKTVIQESKPVAFGILTASGHMAGSVVQNPLSKKNSDAQNPITLALRNLEDLKALPIRVDFKIAAVAVTVDVCPLTGQPIDFDWGLYPDQLQLLSDEGIKEILLVAPANGQTKSMPLDLKLCA
jgi:hypothetical protein